MLSSWLFTPLNYSLNRCGKELNLFSTPIQASSLHTIRMFIQSEPSYFLDVTLPYFMHEAMHSIKKPFFFFWAEGNPRELCFSEWSQSDAVLLHIQLSVIWINPVLKIGCWIEICCFLMYGKDTRPSPSGPRICMSPAGIDSWVSITRSAFLTRYADVCKGDKIYVQETK